MGLILCSALVMTFPAPGITGDVSLSSGRPAREAVVFLEGSEKSEPLPRYVIDQRDKKFSPHINVVTVNTVVDFPNNDVVFHNVFTEYHSERFDLGMYPRGATKRQKFDRPGLAVLLCNIHPQMGAYVMCVDTPYYAVADARGHFRMANVPVGDYTLHAWQEGGETLTRRVKIEPGTILHLKTLR